MIVEEGKRHYVLINTFMHNHNYIMEENISVFTVYKLSARRDTKMSHYRLL